MTTKLTILLLLVFNFAQANTYDLECESRGLFTDIGDASLELNAQITVHGKNDYTLHGGEFSFYIEDDYTSRSGDFWTKQDVTTNKVKNRKNYKPRVYKGHAKFENFTNDFFGYVDFIVPHEALQSGKSNFSGVFILSWIDDHWGGTLTVGCVLH